MSHLYLYHLGCDAFVHHKSSIVEGDRLGTLGVPKDRFYQILYTYFLKVWAAAPPPVYLCLGAFMKGGHLSNIHLLGFLLQIEEYYVNNILIIL